MTIDNDLLEQDEELEESGSGEAEGTKQITPDQSPTGVAPSREDLVNEAMNEGLEQGVITELSSKTDLTIDDLRRIPGNEAYSDEELLAEWKKIEAAERGQAAQAGEEGAEEYKLPFPLYDADGNKINSLDAVDLKALLDGKLTLGYNALGKEQRKTLTEALRNASQGHWNEQRYNTAVTERNQIHAELAEARARVSQYENDRKVWDAALTALSMGNVGPMKALAESYAKAIQQMPQAAPGMVPIEQVRQEQEYIARGTQYINTVIAPKAYEISQRYGANPQEVMGAVQFYLEREPVEFLSEAKIAEILDYTIPALLEQNGYAPNSSGATGRVESGQTGSNEISELKQQIAALQATIAGQKNASVERVRQQAKKVPPAGGGSTPSAGDSQPNFKNRAQMKAYFQGDADWSKA